MSDIELNERQGAIAALADVNSLLVRQVVEKFEAFTGIETNNKYRVYNEAGNPIFTAAEEGDCCSRMCCGSARAFKIWINDVNDRRAMVIERGVRCVDNWLLCIPNCCCQQELTVSDGNDNLIGTVTQVWNCCKPAFDLRNKQGDTVAEVFGPACHCKCCCSDIEFEVEMEGDEVAKISKEYSGALKETFTDADNFSVEFSGKMAADHRALVLATVFLIDFMFFEKND